MKQSTGARAAAAALFRREDALVAVEGDDTHLARKRNVLRRQAVENDDKFGMKPAK